MVFDGTAVESVERVDSISVAQSMSMRGLIMSLSACGEWHHGFFFLKKIDLVLARKI